MNIVNRIEKISELELYVKSGVVCLSDVDNETVNHFYYTANSAFVELHGSANAIKDFDEAEQSINDGELALYDVLNNKVIKVIPSLIVGIVQKTASLLGVDVNLLNFTENKFCLRCGTKVNYIDMVKLELPYLFSDTSKKYNTLILVNKFGNDLEGNKVVFNVDESLIQNTLEGYLILNHNVEPYFINKNMLKFDASCKGKIFPVLLSLVDGKKELTILANKIKGDL